MKVHLDTDIGGDIDDLCALAMLLRWPDVDITGITTVLEHDGKRAGYARYALALAQRTEIPVAAGADLALGCFGLPAGLPPEARYWPEPVPAAPGPIEMAIELLKQSIEQGATVVGIGPYTNLSLLERTYPGTLHQATVCLMGGSINPVPPTFPAWDFSDDYNVQADITSAKHVLEAADPTVVPLEVTVQTALRHSHLPALRQSGPLGQLIAHQAAAFAEDWDNAGKLVATCAGLPSDIINFQHDPLACAVAVGWDGVTLETLPLALEIEAGLLRVRIAVGGRPYRVVTGVDQAKFNRLWIRTVTRGM